MTIFGQNDFLESFHSDIPQLWLNFLEFYYVQRIEGYRTGSFSQMEILEKQWRFEFSKLSRKVVWLPWQHTRGFIDRTEIF